MRRVIINEHMNTSDAIRSERISMERDLDAIEYPTRDVPSAPAVTQNPASALPETDRAQIQEIIEAEGTSHAVVDSILSSRVRTQPLKPRKWSVDGFGPGMASGIVDALKRK